LVEKSGSLRGFQRRKNGRLKRILQRGSRKVVRAEDSQLVLQGVALEARRMGGGQKKKKKKKKKKGGSHQDWVLIGWGGGETVSWEKQYGKEWATAEKKKKKKKKEKKQHHSTPDPPRKRGTYAALENATRSGSEKMNREKA